MEKRFIIILGKGGSGKSTVAKLIASRGIQMSVPYTTRPKRPMETDGVDYWFISREEFLRKKAEGFFAESGNYRDWYYGTAKRDCVPGRVAILTPRGMRQVTRMIPDAMTIYLYAELGNPDGRILLDRMIGRGDDPKEAVRRSISDYGQFDGVEDEVKICISVEETPPEEIASEILSICRGDLWRRNDKSVFDSRYADI